MKARNTKHIFTLVAFSFALIGIASLLTGSLGTGGGCLGTQLQIHTVAGSSGYFELVEPLNNTGDNTYTTLQPIFKWQRYPADLTSYTLQISTDITFGTFTFTRTNIAPELTSWPSGVGTYPITLDQYTNYYWRVIAVDSDTGVQTIAAGSPFKFTTGIVPGTFTLQSPANNSSVGTTPTLQWSATQALNYIVQIDTKTTFNKPLTYDTGSDEQQLSIATTSHTIPTDILVGGVRYYWRVIAVNTGGRTIAPAGTPGYWAFTTY